MHSLTINRFLSILLLATVVASCSRADKTVDSASATNSPEGMAPPTPSADDVDDKVEAALDANPELAGYGLDADDDDNRVVLKGAVRTAEQKALAEQVATALAAGIAIDNRLRIDAALSAMTAPVDADAAEELVENALEADSAMNVLDIDVDEEKGGLVLEGNVKTAEQKAAVEALAKRLAPTLTIVNKIVVK